MYIEELNQTKGEKTMKDTILPLLKMAQESQLLTPGTIINTLPLSFYCQLAKDKVMVITKKKKN